MLCTLMLASILAHVALSNAHQIPGLPQWPKPTADEVEAFGSSPSSWSRWLDFWPFKPHEKPNGYGSQRTYDDYVLLRFNTSSASEEGALRRAADKMFVDVWDFNANFKDILIRDKNKRIRSFLGLLPESLQVQPKVLLSYSELARAIASTYPSTVRGNTDEFAAGFKERGLTHTTYRRPSHRRADDVNNLFFKDYQPLSVITSWMRLVASMFRNQGLVTMFSIGKSYEGRDMPALRIGMRPVSGLGKNTKSASSRKTILVTGGLHGREWISTSTVNFLAWSFVTAYGKDPLATRILDEYDFVFVPVVNVDGYEYTWTVDRLWRKSRQPTGKLKTFCPGYDLDHAFGYRWDAAEHHEDPCSPNYGGSEPFQAVEANQLAKWALNETQHGVDFVSYIDLHSYSQQVLWPYAYACGVTVPNLENMQEVAMNIAKFMRLSSGEIYTVSSACEGAFAASSPSPEARGQRIEASGGAAIDYFFHDLHARYSYQIKLRDTGNYGFLLPSDNIIPTGLEVYQAIRYFGDYLLGNNGRERMYSADGDDEHDELRRRAFRR